MSDNHGWTLLVREALDREDCWQFNLRNQETGRRITVILNDDEAFTYISPKQEETE